MIKLKNKKNPRRIEKKIYGIKKYITRKRVICTILVIILVFEIAKIIPSNLKIYMIDVGQGDCTLIKTANNKTIMIDSGGQENLEEYDVGKEVLVPYLLARGITKLDYIMISHFHADHCNGFIALMNEIKIEKMIIAKQEVYTKEAEKIINLAKEKKIGVIYAKMGQKIILDNETYINILYIGNDTQNLNNNSIISLLKYKNFSMLFTGDAEKEEEADFLKELNTDVLNIDVLKVGHHGSKTSSSQEFINFIRARIAIIGVGKNNNFGHPNERVIERLKENGMKVYRTDTDGEISIEINNKGEIIGVQKFIK